MSHDPTPEIQQPICANCRRPLEVVEHHVAGQLTEVTFSHTLAIEGVECPELVPITGDRASQVSICDFCSSPSPAWAYPARSFIMGETTREDGTKLEWSSVGLWAACDHCHGYIENQDWTAVADRHVEQKPGSKNLKTKLVSLYQEFGANRTGPGVPV